MRSWKFVRVASKVVALTIVVSLSLVVAFVAVAGWLHPESASLPKLTGPFAVGRAFYDWKDEKRLDPFAPEPGTKRELTVWVWYPAEKHLPISGTEYLPRRVREALDQQADNVLRRMLRAITLHLTVDIESVRVHADDDAPIAQTGAAFPVVLFKPAIGLLALQHTSLAEDLASHGYIVVASDSPHTTPVVVYDDGRIAKRTDAGNGRVRARQNAEQETASELARVHPLAPGMPNGLLLPVIREWVEDERFLLNRLAMLNTNDPAGRFTGRLAMNSVGAYGHSFGGATALQFCSEDDRCKAGINIDGALWGEVVKTGIHKPFLFIFSDRPIFKGPVAEQSPDAQALLNALSAVRGGIPNQPSRLLIEGTSHFNFTDYALFNELHVYRALGAYGPIDPARALYVTNRSIRAFFDENLKGVPNKLAQLSHAEFPELRAE